MPATFKHDPLSAIAEAAATGETAKCFADIRTTMRLPLVTSIWRTLAGVDGGLPAAWKAAKPIFESGYPDAVLAALRNPAHLPIPPTSQKKLLERLGLSENEHIVIRQIVDVYTRSNSLNLLVLTALFSAPAGRLPDDKPLTSAIAIPKLPGLMAPEDIDPAIWQLLLNVNQFGASPDEPGLATLWRHLAYWPGVLSIFHDVLAPLQEDGTITRAIAKVIDVARVEGRRLALLRPEDIHLPAPARNMIVKYVTHPGLVARMVAIGNGLSYWLQPDSPIDHG